MVKLKIVAISISIFFITLGYSVNGSLSYIVNDGLKNSSNRLLEGGWLEERDGVNILHVSGSYYEMGYQHGYLLKEGCIENIRAFLDYTLRKFSYDELIEIWDTMKKYIPTPYIEELHGLADGSGVSFENISIVYAATECTSFMGCFGIAAWGNATVDGKLYHARSWDLPFDIRDPVSGKCVHENSVLIIRKPDNGFASLCPSVAGALNGAGGINEKGIGIGAEICWSNDQGFNGPPILIRVQWLLDYADTIEQALDILTTNRTLGWNFIVSDCKVPVGYSVEISANHSYIGTWDDPVEANKPFWSIKNVVRRTNFYINPTLAATQRNYYDPSGVLGILSTLFKGDPYFVVWNNYRVMSNEIEKNLGRLDVNSTISMVQRVYRGETDFILNFIKNLASDSSFLKAWNQWAACAENGDMVVSFATTNLNACENKVHYFNLFDLLNSNP